MTILSELPHPRNTHHRKNTTHPLSGLGLTVADRLIWLILEPLLTSGDPLDYAEQAAYCEVSESCLRSAIRAFYRVGLLHGHTYIPRGRARSSSSEKEKPKSFSSECKPSEPERSPRAEFYAWFRPRFPESELPSRGDIDYIEQAITSRGVSMNEFTHACRKRLTGKAYNPIGLVKWLAKDYAQCTLPVREDPPPAPSSRSCPTCHSPAARLADGITPCPDCKLGQEIARVESRKPVQKETAHATTQTVVHAVSVAPAPTDDQVATGTRRGVVGVNNRRGPAAADRSNSSSAGSLSRRVLPDSGGVLGELRHARNTAQRLLDGEILLPPSSKRTDSD